jgi:hypothetical protein
MLRRKNETSHPPMPFIVGVPRSGTTLLRLMLDAHSQLAIPPETGFILELLAQGFPARMAQRWRFVSKIVPFRTGAWSNSLEAFFRTVTESQTWPDFLLSRREFKERLLGLQPFTSAGGLRAFHRLYAERFGKPRWGDKTPTYLTHLRAIEKLLPESRFIHILRDGRDVALSVKHLPFAPGESIETIAADWSTQIRVARQQGRACRHYLEVRYEDLVTRTTETLQRVCDFVAIPYEAGMEDYYVNAHRRLDEHQARLAQDGSVLRTKEERLGWQRLTNFPPDASRVGRWRKEMTEEEVLSFEKIAGRMLKELGYETTLA